MTQENGPGPILESAIKQIQEICESHELGGYFVLVSPSHASYMLRLPDWSVAKIEGDGIRIKAKGNNPIDKAALEATVHMFQTFQECGANINELMTEILLQLGKQVKIEGGPRWVS